MARPATVARVFAAVLDLADRGGPSALTMEGIAAEAGVGKQTLYRTWPSVHAILFDALVAETADEDASDTHVTIFEVLQATIDELTNEPRASLLRMLAAAIQVDPVIGHEFHMRLLRPQQEQIKRIVAADGFSDPDQATEMLLAPLLFRWFLRMPPLTDGELRDHVANVRQLGRLSSVSPSGRQASEIQDAAGRGSRERVPPRGRTSR